MDQLELYYKQTIFFLSVLGLWPYQNKYFRSVYNIFIFFVYLLFLSAQITAAMKTTHTLHDLLKNIFYISVSMGSFLKYSTYYFQADKIKQLMDEVKRDWRTENDEMLEIMKNFAISGRRYAFYFALIIFTPVFTFIAVEACNSILDAVAPLNYTRPYIIPAVYFVDERKYRFLILIYQFFVYLAFASAFVGSESLIIMWLHHFGAFYVLVSSYIYQGVMEHITVTSNKRSGNSKRLLITAVDIHRRVIKYANICEKIVTASYVLLHVFAAITQSINIFFLSQTIFQLKANKDAMLCLIFTICELVYICYIFYVVQQYINISENVILQMYNTNWYEASLSTQKFLLFIMMNTFKGFRFSLFIFVKPTFEGFVQIMKVCMSFFMVMVSLEGRYT